MFALARPAFIIAVLLGATLHIAQAQTATSEQGNAKEPTGSISGRVTVSGKGAPGVKVNLRFISSTARRTGILKARTDEDGRFRFDALAAGHYRIIPLAPALVSANNPLEQSETSVNVASGEAVEGIDFALVRGGVITGRVTDADGRPIIAKYVKLMFMDASGQKRTDINYQGPQYETDDRGIYRIYGLPAGRYLVSLGVEKDGDVRDDNFEYGYYIRTYHPNVTDESKAKTVELSEGSEATGVDITLGRLLPTYSVSGRIVDAVRGKPVSNILYGYGALSPQSTNLLSAHYGERSNIRGEFRLEGLAPGRFAIITDPEGKEDRYADPVTFEITDRDVGGLEVKMHRGATIEGVASIEGTSDEAVLSQLSELHVAAHVTSPDDLSTPRTYMTKIAPDGHFTLTGLRPGKVNIFVHSNTRKGFSLLRVEHNGIDQREGIEIANAEQITGVRVAVAHSTGVVRGQIKVKSGRLPENVGFGIHARPTDGSMNNYQHVEADTRGLFVIENLAPGEYELMLQMRSLDESAPPIPTDTTNLTQTVTVTNATETEATFVVELKAGGKPQ